MVDTTMWLVGVIVVLAVGAGVTAALGWRPRTHSSPPLWKTTEMGGANAGSAGTFAGFSLAAATFIAGLDVARTSPVFSTVFGMMLIAFLILVVSGWIGGSTPNVAQAEDVTTQSLVLGNLCNSLGVSVTWLALVPLLEVMEQPALAAVFVWAQLIMVLAGAAWVAFFAYRLTMARGLACLAAPVLGIALPGLYRLVAVRQWPTLWPADDGALRFAFVALAAAGLMFALHFGLLVSQGSKTVQQRLRRDGHRLVLVACETFVMVVAFLWFAVALP